MQLSPVSPVQPWDSPIKSHQNTHQEATFTGRSRRQHRSCDQCRKGKRACDVNLVNYPASSGDESTSPILRPSSTADPDLNWSINGYLDIYERSRPILTSTGPCSNCAKTGKRCTLEWLKSVHGVILQRCKRSIEEASGPKKKSSGRKRQASAASSHTSAFPSNIHASSNSDTSNFDLSAFLDHQIPHAIPSLRFPPDPLPSNDRSDLPDCERPSDYLFEGPDAAATQPWSSINNGVANVDFMPFQPTAAELQNSWDSAALSHTASHPRTGGSLMNLQNPPSVEAGNEEDFASFTTGNSATASLPSSYGPTQPQSFNGRKYSLSQGSEGYADPPLDHLQQQLTLSTNQTLLTNGLLRIYHDSMENALSCWLTEKTCPYGVTIPSPATLKNSNPHESMSEEWGSNWSNRIFARVCRLDRASSVVRGRPLTQSEEKLASKALHLAIMSFATQWAQSSNRSTAKFSSFGTEHDTTLGEDVVSDRGGSSTLSTEFDRSIQESFWYQARRALQDSAEVESFRVIFAHIIFSLTQRPLNVAQHVRAIKARRRSSAQRLNDNSWPGPSPSSFETPFENTSIPLSDDLAHNTAGSGVSSLDEVTELEGPPIFLETALRQIFSYRCKLERIERQRTVTMRKKCAPETTDNQNILSTKDRKTFDLLFWLSIMFDTLSAAMNKRPLVVSDEDSDIRHQGPRDGNLPSHHISQEDIIRNPSPTYRSILAKEGDSKLWGDFLIRQKHLRFCHKVARWPCSYEDAASTLCDAAPIKVLLFRKVTHLQTLLSRRVMYEKLEQTILDALQVYQHWNDSYNQFILDCIANHDDLPPRIQSWYVVLAGHWHLAALLLADIIEVIDEGQMGLESQQTVRHSSRLVSKLREQNANVLSDLGRCSCPGYNLSFPQAREFHFAVSEGALLTEPWTVVLIRAFSKAGYILLDRLSHPKESGYGRGEFSRESEISQCQQRCSFCIRALWNLGKKSDMAFLAATALSTALKEVTDSMASKAYLAKYHSPDMEAIRQCSSLPDDAARDSFPFVFPAISSYQ